MRPRAARKSCLLAVEVPEDQRLADLRLARHLGQRRVLVAVFGEQPGGGGEDPIAGLEALVSVRLLDHPRATVR